jgi:hypothetical protein
VKPFLLVGCVVLFAWIVAAAGADIGVIAVSKASARVGDVVSVRVAGYDRAWPRMPLYLVPTQQAPQPVRCRRNAMCQPKSRRAPEGPPYRFLGRITFRRSGTGVVRFRVPRVAAGTYRFVIYCAPCYRGPGGSLITDDASFAIR